MYVNFNTLEYEKILNEKEQEIKTSKEKITILLQQVIEKNNHIKNLEKLLKVQNQHDSLQNNYLIQNSRNEIMNNKNNYFSKNPLKTKSNETYIILLNNYRKLKSDHEELKKENDILYGNINSLTLEKNDINKLLDKKNEEIKELQKNIDMEKENHNKEIQQYKEINDKLLEKINHEKENSEKINLELNDLKISNNKEEFEQENKELIIKIKNLEIEKKKFRK